ncbi:hypothetical protein F383_03319 [Gossypium arboreum]|uniref:Uncharacterized protein n=1 Tax=Gossypium arboreum TaxID=29729 RepID=A0A0B0PR47_GOSAR|nr:hypothetical protein F383_03319 [Gossypium arboreum]
MILPFLSQYMSSVVCFSRYPLRP